MRKLLYSRKQCKFSEDTVINYLMTRQNLTNHLCQQKVAREIRAPELITHVDRFVEKPKIERRVSSM